MPDTETLDERLRAVERALTDGDYDLAEIENAADHHARIEDLDERLAAVEDRLADLDAAVQALRGYVGNVRAVNREVERRADAAIAAVESIEETDLVQPGPVYPPPERPHAEIDEATSDEAVNNGDESNAESDPDLLDRVREVL